MYIIQSENFSLYCSFRITWYDFVCVASDLGLKGRDSILGTYMGFLFSSSWPKNGHVSKDFWTLHRWVMASGDEGRNTLPSHFDVKTVWSHIAYTVLFLSQYIWATNFKKMDKIRFMFLQNYTQKMK